MKKDDFQSGVSAVDHLTYNSRNATKPDALSLRRYIISLIIVIYFTIATVQVWPEGKFRSIALKYADPIIWLFGLKQRWNLFSPDIRVANQFSTCTITFKDGSVKLYEFPHNRRFTLWEKFQRQQLRRFIAECWEEPRYAFFRPFGAQFIAKCNWNPDNPPVLVVPTFNGINVPKFQNYTKQKDLGLRGFDHRTVNVVYEVHPKDFQPTVKMDKP